MIPFSKSQMGFIPLLLHIHQALCQIGAGGVSAQLVHKDCRMKDTCNSLPGDLSKEVRIPVDGSPESFISLRLRCDYVKLTVNIGLKRQEVGHMKDPGVKVGRMLDLKSVYNGLISQPQDLNLLNCTKRGIVVVKR
jgi:hypothetical protein